MCSGSLCEEPKLLSILLRKPDEALDLLVVHSEHKAELLDHCDGRKEVQDCEQQVNMEG